jgi:inhibitor of cysteine peptidase
MKNRSFAKHVALALLIATLAATLSAKTLFLEESDNDTHLCLNPGDTLVIKLQSNVTTGYSWSITTPAETLQQLVSDSERAKDAPLGAGGFQTFRFTAKSAGDATLELKYFRPFEKDKPAAKTYKITVSVAVK